MQRGAPECDMSISAVIKITLITKILKNLGKIFKFLRPSVYFCDALFLLFLIFFFFLIFATDYLLLLFTLFINRTIFEIAVLNLSFRTTNG